MFVGESESLIRGILQFKPFVLKHLKSLFLKSAFQFFSPEKLSFKTVAVIFSKLDLSLHNHIRFERMGEHNRCEHIFESIDEKETCCDQANPVS